MPGVPLRADLHVALSTGGILGRLPASNRAPGRLLELRPMQYVDPAQRRNWKTAKSSPSPRASSMGVEVDLRSKYTVWTEAQEMSSSTMNPPDRTQRSIQLVVQFNRGTITVTVDVDKVQ